MAKMESICFKLSVLDHDSDSWGVYTSVLSGAMSIRSTKPSIYQKSLLKIILTNNILT